MKKQQFQHSKKNKIWKEQCTPLIGLIVESPIIELVKGGKIWDIFSCSCSKIRFTKFWKSAEIQMAKIEYFGNPTALKIPSDILQPLLTSKLVLQAAIDSDEVQFHCNLATFTK